MHTLSELTIQEIDLILEGLSELPLKKSFFLVTKIRSTVEKQLEEKKKEDKTDE